MFGPLPRVEKHRRQRPVSRHLSRCSRLVKTKRQRQGEIRAPMSSVGQIRLRRRRWNNGTDMTLTKSLPSTKLPDLSNDKGSKSDEKSTFSVQREMWEAFIVIERSVLIALGQLASNSIAALLTASPSALSQLV
ncbi:hypothetical protein M514_13797 [Trichuris suis]|uniref:Uncharacterized protein n=1 Tax=Trichuris suis TaxID=68888 RepID=A0A085LK30_9BILA|nr:hypothetical protein M513_13797 [Trichuris suis]KFD71767.1 hypothetical protein M514_13797 [Trichuris suis]